MQDLSDIPKHKTNAGPVALVTGQSNRSKFDPQVNVSNVKPRNHVRGVIYTTPGKQSIKTMRVPDHCVPD